MSSASPGTRVVGNDSITPTSYIVSSAILYTNAGLELDISDAVNRFNIIESIDSPFLEMDIQIVDATNLLEEHKINGNEKIKIVIQRNPIKESNQNKTKFELKLRIAEVFGFVKDLPTKQFYRFRCVSEHLYINASKTLVRPFEGTIGSLIEKICKKDLKIEKLNINTSSKNTIKGIYPRIRPIQAANWLLQNAFENNTHFYFWESIVDGVQLESYKNLLAKDVYKKFEFRPGFTHDIGTAEAYEEQSKRIRAVLGPLGMGKMAQISRGTYASTLHTVDIAEKKYEKSFYSYDKINKLNKHQPWISEDTVDDRKYNQLKESKNYFVSLNSKAFDLDNYHNPTKPTLLKNEAHQHSLLFQNFKIIIPGDFEIKAGQKINMEVIKASTYEHLGEPASMIDKYTSGTYLVKKITHTFEDEFISEVEIMRDSVGVNINA
jgi:hypothetical protein